VADIFALQEVIRTMQRSTNGLTFPGKQRAIFEEPYALDTAEDRWRFRFIS
jgi:hypothetical protein